jgi:NAD+ synthase
MRNIDLHKTAIKISDFIADRVATARAEGVVIGLSGGVDSALAAALCVDAVGAANVYGMMLPCESAEEDCADAITAADHLGIAREIVDLTKTYEALLVSLPGLDNKLARANLKSRLRMCSLYARANQRNYLVCGTTNMVEMHLGYFTKFGDGGCDIEPLVCLLKREVREMTALKKFPPDIALRTASAGLWKGQTDEGDIGLSYARLDAAVLSFKDPSITAPDEDRAVVWRMFNRSEHKREMPREVTEPVYECER